MDRAMRTRGLLALGAVWMAGWTAGCLTIDEPLCKPDCCPVTKACRAELVQVEDERTCYYTECEEICIPPVHWPCWVECFGLEPDRFPRCGTVIAVERLKSDEVVWRCRPDAEYKLVSPCCRCPQCQCAEEGEDGEPKECRCGLGGVCPFCGGAGCDRKAEEEAGDE